MLLRAENLYFPFMCHNHTHRNLTLWKDGPLRPTALGEYRHEKLLQEEVSF